MTFGVHTDHRRSKCCTICIALAPLLIYYECHINFVQEHYTAGEHWSLLHGRYTAGEH